MNIENIAGEPRKRLGKVKLLLLVGAVAAIVLFIAHSAWKYSGSNKWELVRDKDGVQVYALKIPGLAKKQFKVVARMKTTLNRVAAAMTDTSSEACKEFFPSCVGGEVLEPYSAKSQYFVQAFRVELPRPLSPRDLVVKTELSQDPQSKSMVVRCTALPDRIPPDACCVRIKNMHNSWRFTPVDNGEVEVEFSSNAESPVPYFLANFIAPITGSRFVGHLEQFFNKEKYQHAEFALAKAP